MQLLTSKVSSWLKSLLSRRASERCRDVGWCVRIDNPTCCMDRLRAERVLEHLHGERRLWSL